MDENQLAKEFDQLLKELTEKQKDSNDLDQLVNNRQDAIKLHKRCTEILEQLPEIIANLQPEALEWEGFQKSRAEIDKLANTFNDFSSLEQLVINYKKFKSLAQESHKRLNAIQEWD